MQWRPALLGKASSSQLMTKMVMVTRSPSRCSLGLTTVQNMALMSTITHCPCIFAFSQIDHMITLSPTLSALSWSFLAFGRFNYWVMHYQHFCIISAHLPHLMDSFPMWHVHLTWPPWPDSNLSALMPCIPLLFRQISLSAHVFPPTVEHFSCHYQRFFDSTTHLHKFITHLLRPWNIDTGTTCQQHLFGLWY